jgi:hypothetical protein
MRRSATSRRMWRTASQCQNGADASERVTATTVDGTGSRESSHPVLARPKTTSPGRAPQICVPSAATAHSAGTQSLTSSYSTDCHPAGPEANTGGTVGSVPAAVRSVAVELLLRATATTPTAAAATRKKNSGDKCTRAPWARGCSGTGLHVDPVRDVDLLVVAHQSTEVPPARLPCHQLGRHETSIGFPSSERNPRKEIDPG